LYEKVIGKAFQPELLDEDETYDRIIRALDGLRT
jgi:hypothetical protein